MGLTFLVFVQVVRQKSTCLHCLRDWQQSGAVFLAFISLAPIAAQQFMHLTSSIALGGTSLLILISTGIEGMKQLEGYLLKRQYVGFMNLED